MMKNPPYPFEHRNSPEDLLAYHEALDKDEVRNLFRKWADEDERAAMRNGAVLRQRQRDEQLLKINSSLQRLESRGIESKKEFLSVKEVAVLFNKSEKTIRRWTERETLPLPVIKKPNRRNKTWSFDREEVLKWFELYQQT